MEVETLNDEVEINTFGVSELETADKESTSMIVKVSEGADPIRKVEAEPLKENIVSLSSNEEKITEVNANTQFEEESKITGTEIESELINTIEDEEMNENDSEIINAAEEEESNENYDIGDGAENKDSDKTVERLTRLPISRIKSIMKFDDDVHMASQEAIFLVTKATELFISSFMKEVYQCTVASKKKTISKRDVDTAVFSKDCFMFLDGALD